jgi:hypothetical protein
MGRKSMLLSRGKMSVKLVILEDKNPRVDATASQPNPFVNLNAVSLGQRRPSIDCIPRKEIVSEETSSLSTFPTYSSTTRAVYPLNRSHSLVVGSLVTR